MRVTSTARFQTCLTKLRTATANTLQRAASKLRDNTANGEQGHADVGATSSADDWTVDGRRVADMATSCGRAPTA